MDGVVMSPSPPLHNLNIKRRRPHPDTAANLPAVNQPRFHAAPALPPAPRENRSATIALLTTAALTLAGCGLGPEQSAAPLTPEQQEAEWRVRKFQSDIVQALDKVDRDRLQAAAAGARPATRPAGAVSTAVSPIAASTTVVGTRPSQNPVILASSSNDPAGASQHPAPAPAAVDPVSADPAPTPTPEVTPLPESAPQALPVYDPPAIAPVIDSHPVASALPGPDFVSPATGFVISPITGAQGSVPAAVIQPFTLPDPAPPSAMVAMMASAPKAIPDPTPAPSLDEALVAVRKIAEEHPNLKTALALALLNGDKDGQVSQKLSPADQKVFSDLLAALEAMKASPNSTLAQRTAPILEAAQSWRQDADLTLPRLVLASRVDSFGVFAPVAGTFDQGKRYTVILYCEVANFCSQKTGEGWYSTRLSQQESLITEDGLLVWRPNSEEIEDRSLNQRHDFYLVKKLTIPETLAAGKYSLRMSVTDRNSNKIAVMNLPIEIVAK
jgi:hypothetical protein